MKISLLSMLSVLPWRLDPVIGFNHFFVFMWILHLALFGSVYIHVYNCRYVVFTIYWIRPYSGESTSSRPIWEVKHQQAWIVLAWVTSWEVRVLESYKHTFLYQCTFILVFFPPRIVCRLFPTTLLSRRVCMPLCFYVSPLGRPVLPRQANTSHLRVTNDF